GGKTGTSEDGVNTGKYVTSFVGVAPIEDPKLVILITLYNPTGEGGHQGGGVAAPIAGEILGEVLPYLEVQKNEEGKEIVTVPDVTGITVKEAKKILKEIGLELKLETEVGEEYIIEVQTPKEGISLTKGTGVIVE
ncbi:MAG: PASTA domain-containing protein, partial [Clostridia bacterium]|nr:PASTA domain-containing protein [Clostridia bacterium]